MSHTDVSVRFVAGEQTYTVVQCLDFHRQTKLIVANFSTKSDCERYIDSRVVGQTPFETIGSSIPMNIYQPFARHKSRIPLFSCQSHIIRTRCYPYIPTHDESEPR